MYNKRNQYKSGVFFIYSICILTAVICFFPLLWMFLTSLKTLAEITKIPITFFPENFLNFNSYIEIFKRQPIGQALINSAFIAGVSTISSVFLSSLAGYGFSKFNFPGKNIIFLAIVALLIVPFQSIVVSLYKLTSDLGLVDTYPGLMLPFLVSAFGVFFMRNSIANIPSDYIDAARIDGCSYIKVFFRVILPNVKHAIATLAIIKFMWTWNDFFWPLVVTTSKSKYVMPIAVSQFRNMHFAEYELITASATLSTLPLIIVFIILQKQVIKAVAMSGLKG